jgi:hypothetical protein
LAIQVKAFIKLNKIKKAAGHPAAFLFGSLNYDQ